MPVAYADMIYAFIIEEWGLILGGFGLVLLYLILFSRAIRIGNQCTRPFGSLLAIGLGLMLTFQALVNMGVAVQLLPMTGQPLPLVSMGGTSIVVTCIALGMILAVSRSLDRSRGRRAHRDPGAAPRAHPRPPTGRPTPMPDRPCASSSPVAEPAATSTPRWPSPKPCTARQPDTVIEFVGARGRMEMERVPAAGHTITGLPITGIDRKLSARNLLFPFRLLRSLWMSRRIIRRFKPDVAVGVGGFASGPLLWAAAKAGIPTVIQEQNGFPGITNRLLARHVDRVCAGFPRPRPLVPAEKIVETGNPLRAGLIARLGHGAAGAPTRPATAEARRHFGLAEDRPSCSSSGAASAPPA